MRKTTPLSVAFLSSCVIPLVPSQVSKGDSISSPYIYPFAPKTGASLLREQVCMPLMRVYQPALQECIIFSGMKSTM